MESVVLNQRNVGVEKNVGPTISDSVTKALEDCVRTMVSNLPPSTVQKNKARIKRPMNAFMVYSQTARKAMAIHYPTLSYRKLSKALGKIWKVLDDEEKKPFKREAERLRQKHKEDHPDYKFKPIKARKLRPQVTPMKQCVPTAQDLMKIITADCDMTQIRKGVTSSFNLQAPRSPLEGSPFETTSLEELSCQFPSPPATNFETANFAESFQSNENQLEELQLEENFLSLLENVLSNGSQDFLQCELPTTMPHAPQPTASQFQPAITKEHFAVRNLPNPLPVTQAVTQTSNLQRSPGSFFELFNGDDTSCNAMTMFDRNEKFPGDFENFCEFITDDKLVSPVIPVSPTPQNDVTCSDSSRVFINL